MNWSRQILQMTIKAHEAVEWRDSPDTREAEVRQTNPSGKKWPFCTPERRRVRSPCNAGPAGVRQQLEIDPCVRGAAVARLVVDRIQ